MENNSGWLGQETERAVTLTEQEWLERMERELPQRLRPVIERLRQEFRRELRAALREEVASARRSLRSGAGSASGRAVSTGVSSGGTASGTLNGLLGAGLRYAEGSDSGSGLANQAAAILLKELAPEAWQTRNEALAKGRGLSQKQWLGELARMLAKTRREL
jgi:hypothetical protein